MSSLKTKLSPERKKLVEWWNSVKPLELQEYIMKAKADAFNAGYGKKVRRAVFCSEAGEWVEQAKVGNKWLCLHD
jgi:hypothetical protein